MDLNLGVLFTPQYLCRHSSLNQGSGMELVCSHNGQPDGSRASSYLTLLFWGNLYSILEKAMAPHSSTFAWKIPWTEEPGRLQSMRSIELDTTERLQ